MVRGKWRRAHHAPNGSVKHLRKPSFNAATKRNLSPRAAQARKLLSKVLHIPPVSWAWNFILEIFGPRGYLFIGSIVSAYLVVYALFLGQHERQTERAALMMANFFTLTSSSPSNFTYGVSMLSSVASTEVSQEPQLFAPSEWIGNNKKPNEDWLVSWLIGVSSRCENNSCGNSRKNWRGDMSGADFSNLEISSRRHSTAERLDLSGMKLDDSNLRGARVSLASFAKSSFVRGNLMSIDAQGSNFSGVDFRNADLRHAKLGTLMHDENYGTNSNFSSASLRGVNANCASFASADMRNADLSSFHPREVTWKERRTSNFRWVDFSYADLRGANLEGVLLEGADLTKANIAGAKMKGAIYSTSTRFPDNMVPAGMIDTDSFRSEFKQLRESREERCQSGIND